MEHDLQEKDGVLFTTSAIAPYAKAGYLFSRIYLRKECDLQFRTSKQTSVYLTGTYYSDAGLGLLQEQLIDTKCLLV